MKTRGILLVLKNKTLNFVEEDESEDEEERKARRMGKIS